LIGRKRLLQRALLLGTISHNSLRLVSVLRRGVLENWLVSVS
jgi:hypothetical protein